jgi:hypothetical protein
MWTSVLLALEVVCGACDCFTVEGGVRSAPFSSVKQIDLRKRKTVKRKSQPPDLIPIPTFTILHCEQPNEVRAVADEHSEAEQDEDLTRLASPHSSPPEVEGRRSQDFQPTPKEDVFSFSTI